MTHKCWTTLSCIAACSRDTERCRLPWVVDQCLQRNRIKHDWLNMYRNKFCCRITMKKKILSLERTWKWLRPIYSRGQNIPDYMFLIIPDTEQTFFPLFQSVLYFKNCNCECNCLWIVHRRWLTSAVMEGALCKLKSACQKEAATSNNAYSLWL